ncbi:hypothetical protein D3C71_1688380 [compost metagenome]
MKTSLIPPRCAASSFSFKPPMRIARPPRLVSPVMAISGRIGMPVKAETNAVVNAKPAEGPSFGVAPSGK